jgi:ribonuclease J
MKINSTTGQSNARKKTNNMLSNKTRGAALRTQRRNQDDADRVVNQYSRADQKPELRANAIVDSAQKLKLSFLGGLQDVGEKNMAVIEYGDEAIILDCGFSLGVDLPGINYEINDTSYLETIKHKIKAYVLTHGHMDHVGGLKHIVPRYPAPLYGSRYTIGVTEKSFDDETLTEPFTPELIVMNIDANERQKIGSFFVEFIRVTHSIPDPTAICIDTPVGRIIATGDFRLDPEPLDNQKTDTTRLKQLGDEGVLLLMSDSSYAEVPGRTPTEHTLQQSFHDVITRAEGRIFVTVFSSNINRIQMIINAAHASGRKIALDGRSMMSYAEIAVRSGILKVPKGMMVPIKSVASIPDEQLLIMCTGGQGEPNAALQRMSEGEHKYVKLKASDTIVVSSSPIPGNETRYDQISNRLSNLGLHLFRHPTHEIDGCGPLHVSGHAKRDELSEMIRLMRPKFFIPVHGGALRRRYHGELGIQEGMKRSSIFLPSNGDSFYLSATTVEDAGQVPHGSLLIDQSGSVVSGLVVKDRLMLAQEGLLSIMLTIDKKTGQLLSSPDIISRGVIAMRGNEDLVNELRSELKRATQQRFKRVELDRFKTDVREFVMQFVFERTGRSPIVIPVVTVVGARATQRHTPEVPTQSKADKLATDQKRFQEMRARLLTQA